MGPPCLAGVRIARIAQYRGRSCSGGYLSGNPYDRPSNGESHGNDMREVRQASVGASGLLPLSVGYTGRSCRNPQGYGPGKAGDRQSMEGGSSLPTVGSAFSGIGGLDLGLERAGFKVRWQIEVDLFCRRVLARHWPAVTRYGDIRDVQGPGPVDILAGGYPCKQTSTASALHGCRQGFAGKDSGLWREMLRLVRSVEPAWVLVENPSGQHQAVVQADLAEAGYKPSRFSLAVSDLGGPHLRRRVWVVADRHGKGLQVSRAAGALRGRPAGAAVAGSPWYEGFPRGLRVADGVPGGVDRAARIKAVGNAVAPRVAEVIGRLMMEVM